LRASGNPDARHGADAIETRRLPIGVGRVPTCIGPPRAVAAVRFEPLWLVATPAVDVLNINANNSHSY